MEKQKYLDEMKKLEAEYDELWKKIVEATNTYIAKDKDVRSDDLPIIERFADQLCLSGAWIYDRLDRKYPRDRGATTKKIRKALGFTYP